MGSLQKETGVYLRDVVVDEIDGIRIYGRRTNENTLTLNAWHFEEAPLSKIAEMLHQRGYAVKREQFVLDAKKHHSLEAIWPGKGTGPYSLPDKSSE